MGKSTVAALVVERLAGWRLFDPELVGSMLKSQLSDQPVTDFQDWPAWRKLVGPSAAAVATQTNSSIILVQTVTNEGYWTELERSMNEHGLAVTHVCLVSDLDVLRRRIEADQIDAGARQWRLDHIRAFEDAHEWLTSNADAVIDTTHLTPEEVADRVLALVA